MDIDSLTPDKISNLENDAGENGKPSLIKVLFNTPSRSKNIAFLIFAIFVMLKKIHYLFFYCKNTYKNLYSINFRPILFTKCTKIKTMYPLLKKV